MSIITDNLNMNGNLHEYSDTTQELRKDPGDMRAFCEEITIMKTEVKEEYISLPENNFENGNLEPMNSIEQSLNETVVVGSCEVKEADLQENKYRCELCLSDFDAEIRLRSHYELCVFRKKILSRKRNTFRCTYKNCKCTPEQDEPCMCDTCSYLGKSTSDLNLHILHKHSLEPKKYKCKDCKYETHRKASLIRHIRTHTHDRPFKCSYKNCKCAPGQEAFCICDMCEYTCTTNSILQRHIFVKHTLNSTKYKCNDCKYVTYIERKLTLHTCIPTKEKSFKCTYKNCKCSPGEEKPCNCNTCEYVTITKAHFKRHILAKHSTEPKKYKCTDCKYATHMKQDLKRHLRTHSNAKPLKCTK